MFWKKKIYKPKTIDQLYEETEQAYFNGELTEEEFDFYVNQLYNEEIQEMEEKK